MVLTGSTDGAPWCFTPQQNGYTVVSTEDTPLGLRATLQRINTPSWFGADFQSVHVDLEFQTDDRVRIKVGSTGKAFRSKIE